MFSIIRRDPRMWAKSSRPSARFFSRAAEVRSYVAVALFGLAGLLAVFGPVHGTSRQAEPRPDRPQAADLRGAQAPLPGADDGRGQGVCCMSLVPNGTTASLLRAPLLRGRELLEQFYLRRLPGHGQLALVVRDDGVQAQ